MKNITTLETSVVLRLNLHPEEDEAVADWFYDPKPLLDFNNGEQVNGSSYRKWTLNLPQMSVLYRLANQLLSGENSLRTSVV